MERLARLKLLVTIVDRPRGEAVARICGGLGVHLHLGMLGRGTASSEVLDFLGLGETDKAVILTLAPEPLVPLIRGELVRGLHLRRPGKGILFTLPLSGINRRAAACLSRPVPEETTEGARGMEENRGAGGYRYELIVASVDQGQTDQVMDAARLAKVKISCNSPADRSSSGFLPSRWHRRLSTAPKNVSPAPLVSATRTFSPGWLQLSPCQRQNTPSPPRVTIMRDRPRSSRIRVPSSRSAVPASRGSSSSEIFPASMAQTRPS